MHARVRNHDRFYIRWIDREKYDPPYEFGPVHPEPLQEGETSNARHADVDDQVPMAVAHEFVLRRNLTCQVVRASDGASAGALSSQVSTLT